jgi:Flp pilus assembly protein TadD
MAYNNRAWARYLAGQYADGVTDATRATELDPRFASAWSRRGLLYEKLNERDKAVADFKQALALDAAYAEALDGLKRLQAN